MRVCRGGNQYVKVGTGEVRDGEGRSSSGSEEEDLREGRSEKGKKERGLGRPLAFQRSRLRQRCDLLSL